MAIKKVIEIDVDTNKSVSNVNNLNAELNKTNKEVNQTKENLSGVTSVADKATGGMISKFQGLTGVLGNVSKGFTTMRGAIIATGIGALVVLVGSLISAFSASEEGQNKFAKIMGVIGSVVGNVIDVISDLGEIIIGVLSGDSKAIKSATDFGKKIFDVVGLPIKNIVTIVTTLAKTLGELLSGDFSGALDNLKNGVKEVGNNFKDAKGAIEDTANSVKKFGEEALKDAKIAQQIADARAKADKTERELIVKRAEGDRKIAELRENAVQRDKFSQAERIKFLKEAQAIETNLTNQEIAVAKLRADAKTKENALSKSNKEALLEEENLKAKVIQLETQRLQGNRRLVSQIQSLQAQENAEAKSALAEKIKLQQEAEKEIIEERLKNAKLSFEEQRKIVNEDNELSIKDKKDFLNKINEEEKKSIEDNKKALLELENKYKTDLENLNAKTEQEKLDLQKQRDLAEIERVAVTEEQKAKLKKSLNEKYAILQSDLDQKLSKEKIAKEDAEWQRYQELTMTKAEYETLLLTQKYEKEYQAAAGNAELQKALREQLDEDIKAVDEKEAERKRILKDQEIALAGQTLGKISEMLGKNSKAGKAFAVAQALFNTYQGITAELATKAVTPYEIGLKVANIAFVASTGFKAVKQILSTSEKGGNAAGGSTVAGGGAGGGGGAPAPQFNIVGQSSTNQLSATIAGQQNRPVQTYVVGNQVTTQQALDRNAVGVATFG